MKLLVHTWDLGRYMFNRGGAFINEPHVKKS